MLNTTSKKAQQKEHIYSALLLQKGQTRQQETPEIPRHTLFFLFNSKYHANNKLLNPFHTSTTFQTKAIYVSIVGTQTCISWRYLSRLVLFLFSWRNEGERIHSL